MTSVPAMTLTGRGR